MWRFLSKTRWNSTFTSLFSISLRRMLVSWSTIAKGTLRTPSLELSSEVTSASALNNVRISVSSKRALFGSSKQSSQVARQLNIYIHSTVTNPLNVC